MERALAPVTGGSGIDGIPASYDDGRQWLRNGLRRQPRATAAALICAYSAVWFALWGAFVGAFLGLLIASNIVGTPGSGSDLHVSVGQTVTPEAMFLGLIFGAFFGFLLTLKWLTFSKPLQWLVGLIVGLLVTVILVVAIAAYERLFLRWRGYRRLTRDEVRHIAPLVKDIAEAMELDGLPRFAMVDSVMPGAWSHMRTIVLSTGLLQTLSDADLRAVLAHELKHWQTGDSVASRLIWAAAWPIALNYNIGMVLTRTGKSKSPYGPFMAFIGWVFAWPAWVILKLILLPITAHNQRRYEYEADAAVAALGDSQSLISALAKLSAYENARTGWEQAMSSTHPATALRIEALQRRQPDDAIYQEDELERPHWADVKRLLSAFWRHRETPVSVADPGQR